MSTMITVKYILPNPNNPRKEAGDVTELANSIAAEGLKEPLLVRPAKLNECDLKLGNMQQYVLEDGLRRLTAFRAKNGKDAKIECHIVRPPEGDDPLRRALVIGLVTDVHKKSLNPMERALAYERMNKELGMDVKTIAKTVGLTQSSVYNSMLLLDLAPKSQERVIRGTLKVKDAEEVVKDHRSRNREKTGRKPVEVGWEPDFFTPNHILAKKAKLMCDSRGHGQRRRLGGVACGNCWELAIRQDERKITIADIVSNGGQVPQTAFMPPLMVPNDSAHVVSNGTRKETEG